MDKSTYVAFQADGRGGLAEVALPLKEPSNGEVRIRVEACGVCRTDAATVEGGEFEIAYPRVPGHEVVGRIDAVGPDVSNWAVGERVGVGFLAGPCGRCAECRRGNFTMCLDQHATGVHRDGGYAERMIASSTALVAIPDDMDSVHAAPLLCAGITTFKALRDSQARPGDLVAIQGVGGLGHLAIQYARKMGFRVAAVALGPDAEGAVRKLGAHHYIDSGITDPATALQALGGAQLVLTTVSNAKAVSRMLGGIAKHGQLIVIGVGPDPIEVPVSSLIHHDMTISGSLTGTTIETEDALAFSALQDIQAMIETLPLAQAPEAYGRMMRNEAKFRIVLTA
jgi:alcohol dehydrogenase, propanol-preferring